MGDKREERVPQYLGAPQYGPPPLIQVLKLAYWFKLIKDAWRARFHPDEKRPGDDIDAC